MDFSLLTDRAFAGDLIATVLLVVSLLLLGGFLRRVMLTREGVSTEERRRRSVSLRNGLLLGLLTGLVLIWARELHGLAVSLVAVAAALVLATKELIMCVSGGLLRAASDAFHVGDRIEVAGVRGEVVDLKLLSTTILEIGTAGHLYTGRGQVIPNSLLLTHPVVNENYMGDYAVHVIRVPLGRDADWKRHEAALLEAARTECEPHLDDARRHMQGLESRQWLDTPSVEPRVSIDLPEAEELHLLLRFAAPVRRRGRLQQAILRRYLDALGAAP